MANRTCSFIKAGGIRCKGSPIKGSDLCAAHDPATQEARRAGAKRGGQLGGRGRKNAEGHDLRGQLADLYAGVASGAIPAKTGAVLAQVSNTQLRAAEYERRSELESGDFVDRAEVMELVGAFGYAVRESVGDREILEQIWGRVEPMIHAFSERRIRSP